jgi:hypothetical protein
MEGMDGWEESETICMYDRYVRIEGTECITAQAMKFEMTEVRGKRRLIRQ